MTWRERAACAGYPVDWWYCEPPNGVRFLRMSHEETMARTICDGCPVRRECLLWAIRNREAHGIWGGCNLKERRSVARFLGLGLTRVRKDNPRAGPLIDLKAEVVIAPIPE